MTNDKYYVKVGGRSTGKTSWLLSKLYEAQEAGKTCYLLCSSPKHFSYLCERFTLMFNHILRAIPLYPESTAAVFNQDQSVFCDNLMEYVSNEGASSHIKMIEQSDAQFWFTLTTEQSV